MGLNPDYPGGPKKPAKPRPPRPTGTPRRTPRRSSAPPVANHWTSPHTNQVNADIGRLTNSLAQQTGTDAALSEIFSMMIQRRWDNQDYKREQSAFALNDARDAARTMTIDATRQQQAMEEKAYGEFVTNGGNPNEWDAQYGSNFQTEAPIDTNSLNPFKRPHNGNGKLNNFIGKLADAAETGQMDPNAIGDMFKMMQGRRFENQDFMREQKGFAQDDARTLADTTAIDSGRHDQAMELKAYREFIDNGGDPNTWSFDPATGAASNTGSLTGNSAVDGMLNNFGIDSKPTGPPIAAEVMPNGASNDAGSGEAIDKKAKDAGGWLGNLAGKVNDVTHIGDVAGAIADNGAVNAAQDSAVGHALAKVADESGAGLMWGIDKLSRPVYATAAATDMFNTFDTDTHDNPDPLSSVLKGIGAVVLGPAALLQTGMGKNPLDVVDDLNPKEAGQSVLAGLKGFTNGGFGNADEPKLFDDVIAHNAERDNKNNYLDSKVYQQGMGLVGDVAFDPLSFIGFGLGSTAKDAATTAQDIEHATKVRSLADDLAKMNIGESHNAGGKSDGFVVGTGRFGTAEVTPKGYSSDQIFNMLGGARPKSLTLTQRSNAASIVEANIEHLTTLLGETPLVGREHASAVKKLVENLEHQRTIKMNEFADETFVDMVQHENLKAVAKGEITTEQVTNFESVLKSVAVAQHIPEARQYDAAVNKLAKAIGFGETRPIEGVAGSRIKRTPWENLQIELKTLETRATDKSLSAASRDSAKASFEKLRQKLTNGVKEVGSDGKFIPGIADIEASPLHELIPELAHDTRFSPDMLDGLFAKSRAVSFKNPAFANMAQRGTAMTQKIKELEKAHATASERKAADPVNYKGDPDSIQLSLDVMYSRRARENKHKDLTQADSVVRLLEHHVAGQGAEEGGRVYRDVKRVKEIEAELKDVQARKALVDDQNLAGGTSQGSMAIDDAAPTGILSDAEVGSPKLNGSSVEHSFTGERASEKIGDAPRLDDGGELIPSASRTGFYDLVERERALKAELKSLEGLPEPKRKMLTEVPEAFGKTDPETGQITADIAKLKEHIPFNYKAGGFSLKRTGDEATDKWLMAVHHVLDDRYATRFHEVFDKKVREIERGASKPSNGKKWDVKTDPEYRDFVEHHGPKAAAKKQKEINDREDAFNALAPKPIKAVEDEVDKVVAQAAKKDWPAINKAQREAVSIASKHAYDGVAMDLKHNRLSAASFDNEVRLSRQVTTKSSEKEIADALEAQRSSEMQAAVGQAKIDKRGATAAEIKKIDQSLEGLRFMHSAAKAQDMRALTAAKEGRVIMEKRLREDAILRIMAQGLSTKTKHLTINGWGGQELFKIPGSEAMFKASEKAGGFYGIKQTRQIFADAFKSPASRIHEDLQLVRNRAMGLTPIIIEHHVKELQNTLGQFKAPVRDRAFKDVMKGIGDASNPAHKAIMDAFEPIIKYANNKYQVGDEMLALEDLNKFLPKYLVLNEKFVNRGEAKTVPGLIAAMREGKTLTKGEEKMLSDPYRAAWDMRVAVEQAVAFKALQHTVKSSFGVRRVVSTAEKGRNVQAVLDENTTNMIEKLKNMGWDTIPEIGETHMFPPEIRGDVDRLFKMLEPANAQMLGRGLDHATGYWKTMTTIYNPGYWTRNGIGEGMSSWLAGVHDVRYYKKAWKLIGYARHDGKDLEALRSQFPSAALKDIKTNSQKGKEVAITLRGNRKVTYEEVWTAMHDQGIKTGFINTEFEKQYSKIGSKARALPVGKQMANTHQKMRSAGEWYEDYWRAAHFMHAMKASKSSDLATAAAHAAKEVRKYHFDYTDFTKFEKMFMLRAFPFYKWTRKALPLMVSMLFTKPGKVMGYNKGMNALSNTISTNEMVDDKNGFAPNFEAMTPGFIQDMWAYSMGQDAEDKMSYFNMATPQMDSYKTLVDPAGAAQNLLNPFIKIPLEEGLGHTIGKFDKNLKGTGTWDQATRDHLVQTTPAGNMYAKVKNGLHPGMDNALTESDPNGNVTGMDESMLSFLTGLGFYEDKGFG